MAVSFAGWCGNPSMRLSLSLCRSWAHRAMAPLRDQPVVKISPMSGRYRTRTYDLVRVKRTRITTELVESPLSVTSRSGTFPTLAHRVAVFNLLWQFVAKGIGNERRVRPATTGGGDDEVDHSTARRRLSRPPVRPDHPLTKREQLFVAEYLVDLNAAQAAIRAGYKPQNAAAQASRLSTKANVRRRSRRPTRPVKRARRSPRTRRSASSGASRTVTSGSSTTSTGN
jgi:hypothetical protein